MMGSKRGRWAAAVAFASTMAIGASAVAQPPGPPPGAPPSSPPSGPYRVEPEHTEILFGVSHLGFTMYYGVFSQAHGRLFLDVADPTHSRLEVAAPVASVFTPSARLADELKSPQWLDAGQFPQMMFRATRIVMTGPRTAQVDGELSLHGVTRPLTLQAKFNRGGVNPLDHAYTIGFEATGVVHRGEFGVTQYEGAIGDEVTLTISAAFEREPG